jgi:release factor glutamine methyltransferase
VPRRESTPLVAWAADEAELPRGGRVLDLCSGVGAIGLALSVRRPDAEVVCVERDDTAVQYLRRNAARHAGATGTVHVRVADLGDPQCLAADRGVTDLILANPPYVPPHIRLLPEWAEHQPSAALYSGADGLDLIRRIAGLAGETLRPGGRLALEHDRSQPDDVRRLLEDGPFTDVTTLLDTAEEPRITVARRQGTETTP